MDIIGLERQSLKLIEAAAHSSDKAILFFSGGKDSVVVAHLLQKVYKREDIIFVFMPFVDGLKETELITGMAGKLGYELNLYQHWRYYVDKAQGSYCMPQGKAKKLFQIYCEVREDFGDLPIFYGAKASDGMWRRLVTGNGKENRSVYAPIYEWSMYDVLFYIRKNNLEYLKQEGGRVSGVDLSPKYILWAYGNQRQSYDALKKEFPLIEAVVKREEIRKKRNEQV